MHEKDLATSFHVALLMCEVYLDFIDRKSLKQEIDFAQKKGATIEQMTKFERFTAIPDQTSEAARSRARTCKSAILCIERMMWANCKSLTLVDRCIDFRQGVRFAQDTAARSNSIIQARLDGILASCDLFKFDTIKKPIYFRANPSNLESLHELNQLILTFKS